MLELICNESDTEYYEIDVPSKNVLSPEKSIYVVRFLNVETNIEVNNHLRRYLNGPLCATHMTWHWNTPHVFIYNNEAAMLMHVCDKILEDWKQYQRLEANEIIKTDRLIQRLIPLRSTDYVRRITPVGSIYPIDEMDNVIGTRGGVDALMEIADTYYKTDHIYSDLYKRVYSQYRKLFMTKRQFDTYYRDFSLERLFMMI